MPLEGRGYVCQSLDLGAPVIREVTQNRPDQDGIDDRTLYMGGRTVTAAITALAGAGARIDEVASAFGPYMIPSARPTLHYILDRGANDERTMVLRAAAYGWPIVGDNQRDISLQWIAADPIAWDALGQSATAWTGTGANAGRAYALTFNRAYPAQGSAAVPGTIATAGDVPVRPMFLLYGPLSNGIVQIQADNGTVGLLEMIGTARIDAGHYWAIDAAAHTAWLDEDPTQSVLSQLDWDHLVWPTVTPGWPGHMTITGTGTSQVTQCQAQWADGYLW
jgi:hypothetical protein